MSNITAAIEIEIAQVNYWVAKQQIIQLPDVVAIREKKEKLKRQLKVLTTEFEESIGRYNNEENTLIERHYNRRIAMLNPRIINPVSNEGY